MKNKPQNTKKRHSKAFIQLIEALVQEFKPLQIYEFAQYKHKATLQSVFVNGQHLKQCIHYLFMIADASITALNIQAFLDAQNNPTDVIVLGEAQANLLKAHHNCNGFYASIVHHGKLCYGSADPDVYASVRQPNIRRFLGRAITHWRSRLKMAKGFLEAGEQALEADHEQICLFLFYKASEQVCKGLIYVFMGYQEQCSNLKRLLQISACFSSLPLQHFMGTPDNEALLDIMCKNIALNNCKEETLPADKSIYRFLELVESFLKLIDQLCIAQLAGLQKLMMDNGI